MVFFYLCGMWISEVGDVEYAIAKSWWEDHGWEVVRRDALSDMGIMVWNESTPIYAGWVYYTGSNITLLEWIVSNKSATPEEKSGGMEVLVDEASNISKSLGAKFMMTFSNNNKLINKLTSIGYQETDKGVTHMIKPL
jgi:hypothetical protein